ncbi:MAG: GNAT family N-acetyltransferase [Eubacteriales bacterium]|nr:GNAT family N-acetyltransferase [Eubacteriales bacterium]
MPEGFVLPEAREEYIRESTNLDFFAAYNGDRPIGFIATRETGRDTLELYVMGVLEEYHRKGVGRALFERAKAAAARKSYSFLQVKTVQMGSYDNYDRTNRFYQAVGFKEFELFPSLWDENNHCQIHIMSLK